MDLSYEHKKQNLKQHRRTFLRCPESLQSIIYDMMRQSYADKTESYVRIELKTFLKTGFAQIFLAAQKIWVAQKCPGPYVYVCPFKNLSGPS